MSYLHDHNGVPIYVYCCFSKRYINPHDRVSSAELAEELKRVAEENNTSMSSRFVIWMTSSVCIICLHSRRMYTTLKYL